MYAQKKYDGFDKKRTSKGKLECTNGRVEAVQGDADQTYRCKNIVRCFLITPSTLTNAS